MAGFPVDPVTRYLIPSVVFRIERLGEMAIRDFDDILPHVGSFGRFQKRILLLSLPVNYFLAVVYMAQIYQTLVSLKLKCIKWASILMRMYPSVMNMQTPGHWCAVPELDHLDALERRVWSIPLEERDGEMVYSRCRMFDVNYTHVIIVYNT